jgi:arylsulfatase A-like enzyme
VSEDGREFCDERGSCATDFLLAADREGRALSREEIARLVDLYHRGIRALDDRLGELLDALRVRGLYDRSLIVLTSDHGEEFREHGLFIHSQTYDETIAVPLLIKLPGGRHAGTVVDALADPTDLLPTVLDFLDLPAPSYVQGQSLLPLVAGAGPPKEAVVSRDKHFRQRFALRTTRHKLIHDLDGGAVELYDLVRDPGERTNVGETHPQQVAALRRLLARRLDADRRLSAALVPARADGASVLTEEARERLRALGYLQ